MVTLFRTANPILLIVLIALSFAFNLNLFLNDVKLVSDTTAPLSQFVLQILLSLPSATVHLLYIAYLVFSAVYLSWILAKHQIIQSFNFVPALFFVAFFSLLNTYSYFSPIFISIPILILYLNKLFSTIFSDNNLSNSFDTGFLAGVLTLFYLPFGIFILVSLLAYFYLTNFYWRYWLSIIIGFVAPFLMAFVAYLLMNFESPFLANLFGGNQAISYPIVLNQVFFIQIACLLITIAVLIIFKDGKMFKLTLAYKKIYFLLVGLFVLFVLMQFRHHQFSYEPLLLNFLIGIIFISTFAFQQKNELIANAAHVLILLATIYVQYFAVKLV